MKKSRLLAARLASAVMLALVAGQILVTTSEAAEPAESEQLEDCGTFIETGQTVCVEQGADLKAAVLRATGKTIVTGNSAHVSGKAANLAYLVVEFNEHENYGGAAWQYYSSTRCTSGAYKNYPQMWIGGNDEVSSYRGYSGCSIQIYEDINYGGASLPYAAVRSSISGAMKDETSSFKATG